MFECDLQPVQQLIEHRLSLHGEHPLASILRYHFATGGKYLRARLALATAKVLKVPIKQAELWAAACEMAHNATLIHDDIQDGDELRRDQPTVWRTYGVAQAINAGDLLLMLPTTLLGDGAIPSPLLGPLLVRFHRDLQDVIVGQGWECAPLHPQAATWAAYLHMVQGKTSALFTLPVAGIAILAGVSEQRMSYYTAPFLELGSIFQMQDDVLDLLGKKGRSSRGEDIREGKLSALIVAHLAIHPQDEAWLLDRLQASRLGQKHEDIPKIVDRLTQEGALQGVLHAIDSAIQRACSVLPEELIDVWWFMLITLLQPIEEAYRRCGHPLPQPPMAKKNGALQWALTETI